MAQQDYKFLNEAVKANVADPGQSSNNAGSGVNNQVISVSQLSPAPQIDLSNTFSQASPDTSSAFIKGLSTGAGGIQDYIKSITPELTQNDITQQSYLNRLAELKGQNTGKTAYQIQQENLQGVPDLQKNLAGINSQIQVGLAELNKQDADLAKAFVNAEGQAIPIGEIQGQQRQAVKTAAVLKTAKAAEVGLLQARALGLTGQIDTAQKIASRAVDLKYKPIEDEISVLEAQMKAIEPALNREQQTRLLAQQVALGDRKIALEAEKEKDKTIQDLALKASSFNAPSDIVSAISNSKSIVDAINAAGKYTSDPLERVLKQSQIESNKADIAYKNAQTGKIAQEIAESKKKLELTTVPGSSNDFTVKLLNSAVNKDNLSATERESISKALTVVGQLDSLQSNISKQNKTGFFKGKVQNFMASIGQNADVGTINAQLQAIVPNLARGTYGEVGVLTDNDIANYRKTLPNLTSPKEQNDAVLALTLKTVKNSIENKLSVAANSGINVSGFVQDYNQLTKQINDIENRIGVSRLKVNEIVRNNMSLGPMIKELYAAGASDSDVLEALGAK